MQSGGKSGRKSGRKHLEGCFFALRVKQGQKEWEFTDFTGRKLKEYMSSPKCMFAGIHQCDKMN
ncbi:hypothetical protein BK146_14660 [Paenibacillus sp. FSL R7-0333]|nr:hypothetical protein BK146_14660 [Paenibacillus sp. FSL R7-0333]